MIAKDSLKNILHKPELSRADKLLIILASNDFCPKKVREIMSLAKGAGINGVRKWNVSDILNKTKGKAINTSLGWELTNDGKRHVSSLGISDIGPLPGLQVKLRGELQKINDTDTASFVEEAISCLEGKRYRAAVVLSWAGAVSLLYNHVLYNHLTAFNMDASKQDKHWKNAKNADDLSRMKEYDFLQALVRLSVIGKNVKEELEQCLKLRNACGHPNSLKLGENKVAAHLEVLLMNVFSKYA